MESALIGHFNCPVWPWPFIFLPQNGIVHYSQEEYFRQIWDFCGVPLWTYGPASNGLTNGQIHSISWPYRQDLIIVCTKCVMFNTNYDWLVNLVLFGCCWTNCWNEFTKSSSLRHIFSGLFVTYIRHHCHHLTYDPCEPLRPVILVHFCLSLFSCIATGVSNHASPQYHQVCLCQLQ